MFDEQAYLDANPDLPDSWSDAEAQAHYISYGYDEGRYVYWSAADYMTLNPDLAGMTDEQAFSHWITYGMDEGRVAWFQADEYLEANEDLAGMTDAEALAHWINYGRDEGRIQGFDAAGYLELNSDLPSTWTYAEALNHYYQYGEDEGRAFDPYIEDAESLSGEITATTDGDVTTLALNTEGGEYTLTADDLDVDGGDGLQVLRLTGDASVRVDLTTPGSQLEGIDLDNDGTILPNGIENNVSGADIVTVSNYEVLDAYARNPIDETDLENNYFGDIAFDGTGFGGDGVNTDGNIYLGGRGVDTAFGGIGNDFMAGGGVAAGRFVAGVNDLGVPVIIDTVSGLPVGAAGFDTLSGGRNADFFFIELSALDNTDGNGTLIDGGQTFDNDATQDSDWVLLEASDDNEPATVNLGNNITLAIGQAATIIEIEHLDASGDLYSFIDSFDAVLGGMREFKAAHDADGSENSGIGSTGQLIVNGDINANIVIGGYDNDQIFGNGGNDILFGGKLNYLLAYANNPNLLDADGGLDLNVTAVGTVNDGRDIIMGGAGSDSIIFEMDGGTYEGGGVTGVTGNAQIAGDNDILYLTNFSMGRMQGQTAADELSEGIQAQTEALDALTDDSTIRIDLGVGNGTFFKGYGGADTLNNEINGVLFTADQTNYAPGVGRTTIQDIDGVIATGLGALDYDADGNNVSDLSARYQANFFAIDTDMDLRGINNADNAGMFGYNADGTLDLAHNVGDDTLYANTGDDVLEGRAGNDLLSGGSGHDDFYFVLGADDVDVVHRQDDEDNDNIFDGTFSQDYRVTGDGISADPSYITYEVNNPQNIISVLFSLDGTPIAIGGAGITSAMDMVEIAAEVNTQLQAIDTNLSAEEVNGDLIITDASGRSFTQPSIAGDLSDDDFVAEATIDNGTPSQTTDDIDRILFKSYANRTTNLGTDDQQAELGVNAYAQDMVVGFVDNGDGTTTTNLVQGQRWDIQFQNLSEGDVVTVTLNGVDYSRTVAVGESTDVFILNFFNQINTQTWDKSTTSGTVLAGQNDVFTAPGSLDETVLTLTGDTLVYMAAPVVSITNTNGTPGTFAIADVSGSTVELVEYDGRNNDLNEDTVLFVGNTGNAVNYGRDAVDPTDISDGSDYSWSVLATALTAGGTLTGSDAILVDLRGNDGLVDTALHGDDLLIGDVGDDIINAGTGNDTILGSAGTDTVDGGGNNAFMIQGNHTDVLVFNEDTFAAGTEFYVQVGGIGKADQGTVTVSNAGDELGVTTYAGIERVATFSNTAQDTLDFSTLSDEIAAVTTAGATQTQRDMLANEGVTFSFAPLGGGMTYTVDLNNDDDTLDKGELNAPGSNVTGIENIVGGGANDTVIIVENQIGATNLIDLAGNAHDQSALTVGMDTVTYDHSNVGWDDETIGAPSVTTEDDTPDMTVAISNANTIVTFSGGILGTTTSSDTLTGVEALNVTNGALSLNERDVLDVSGLTDAIVNYGGNLAVLDSLQTNGNGPDITSETFDLTRINAGGVAEAGIGQGAEVLTITGITELERVTGGAGNDRVVTADNMDDNLIVVANAGSGDLATFGSYIGTGFTYFINEARNGVYQFNLGDGDGDMLDYTNETGDVAVVLDTSGLGPDRIVIDDTGDGALNTDAGDRVDTATGVERYFGGGAVNRIDLTGATVDTTITFSQEVTLNGTPSPMDNGNEFLDPDGYNGVADTDMLGIEVSNTGDGTVYGRFMDDPNTTGALWTEVIGNAMGETVIVTDNESAVSHTFTLKGGDNTVDYSALTTLQTAPVVFAAAVTTDDVPLGTNATLTSGYTVTPSGSLADVITIERDVNSGSGTLTVIATAEDNDNVNIAAWNVVAANSYNVVNLQLGFITEDALNTNPRAGNFDTLIEAFEDVTGSDAVDHITGSGQSNNLDGAAGNDLIQGNGGADVLTGGNNDDRFIYTSVNDGDATAGLTAVDGNEADAILDFNTGADVMVITGTLQQLLEENGTAADVAGNGAGDLSLDSIFFYADAAADFTAANVAAAVNTGGNAFANLAAGDDAILVVNDGTDTRVYYFHDNDGNTTVDAGVDELRLLTEFTGQVITNAVNNVVTRVQSAAGSQIIDVSSTGIVELAYDAMTDSTLGSRDELDQWDYNKDLIDLSALNLGGLDLDADNTPDNLEAIIQKTPVSVDGASLMPDFFLDTVNDLDGVAGVDYADRAVVVENETGTNNYRVFVDVNGDGDFNAANDMVFDITNEVNAAGGDVTQFTVADFIFA